MAITSPAAAWSAQLRNRGDGRRSSAAIPPMKLPTPGSRDTTSTVQKLLMGAARLGGPGRPPPHRESSRSPCGAPWAECVRRRPPLVAPPRIDPARGRGCSLRARRARVVEARDSRGAGRRGRRGCAEGCLVGQGPLGRRQRRGHRRTDPPLRPHRGADHRIAPARRARDLDKPTVGPMMASPTHTHPNA